jgi:hypothetical protein
MPLCPGTHMRNRPYIQALILKYVEGQTEFSNAFRGHATHVNWTSWLWWIAIRNVTPQLFLNWIHSLPAWSDTKGTKEQETGENYVMRNFIICTLRRKITAGVN